MAESNAHKFGQLIGNFLEASIVGTLEKISKTHDLYLDKKGPRPARHGLKLSWTDLNDNKHDLDFVLESKGTAKTLGNPVGFIEIAWRRYTKHSRNKAQEIQGALQPLKQKYLLHTPLLGVVLAGKWTEGALKQLRSLGFKILLFDYDKLVQTFNSLNIDISFTETTSEAVLKRKLANLEKVLKSDKTMNQLIKQINSDFKVEIETFSNELNRHFSKKIQRITIRTFFSNEIIVTSVQDAINSIKFIEKTDTEGLEFTHFELEIIYSNQTKINATFLEKEEINDFLNSIS